MTRPPRFVAPVTALIGLAVVLASALVRPTGPPTGPAVPPLASLKISCPVTSAAIATSADSAGDLLVVGSASKSPSVETVASGKKIELDAAGRVPVTQPVQVAGDQQPVAGVWQDGNGVSQWGGCEPPRTRALIQLGRSERSDLLLVNPDDAAATLSVRYLGADGEITVPGTRGILVSRHSSIVVPVSAQIPAGAVAVEVVADNGRVFGVGRMASSTGSDVVSRSEAAMSTMLGGVPAGSSSVQLTLTNPGLERATLTVQALTAEGTITLAGADDVSLEAGHTRVLDLTAAVGRQAVSLHIVADHPVAGAATVQLGKDLAVISGRMLGASGQLITTGNDQNVVLANPSTQPTTVTLQLPKSSLAAAPLQRQTVSVPAGTQVQVPVKLAGRVVIDADRPLAAGAILKGQGISIEVLSREG